MKKNKNWWGIVNKETEEIVSVLPTRDLARVLLSGYNSAHPTHKIEKVYIISESHAISEAKNSDM